MEGAAGQPPAAAFCQRLIEVVAAMKGQDSMADETEWEHALPEVQARITESFQR